MYSSPGSRLRIWITPQIFEIVSWDAYWDQEKLFDEKNRDEKSCDTVFFNISFPPCLMDALGEFIRPFFYCFWRDLFLSTEAQYLPLSYQISSTSKSCHWRDRDMTIYWAKSSLVSYIPNFPISRKKGSKIKKRIVHAIPVFKQILQIEKHLVWSGLELINSK